MTPERAAYHRLMLLAGLQEEFEKDLDFALETEDPITAPILDLAFCMSDLNQTISVLYNYTLDYSVDEQQVYDMIMTALRRQYADKKLSASEVCEILSKIQRICDSDEPWINLYTYLHEYELMDEGIISQELFEAGFEAIFLHGERIDVWALQKQRNQKKKKSLLDFFRKQK